jgi:hypothetical protein
MSNWLGLTFLWYLGNILQRAMVWFGYEAPSATRRSNSHALGTCGISEENGCNPSPSYKSNILGEVFFWQACAHSCVDRRLLHAPGLSSLWTPFHLDISTECCWLTFLYNLSPQITDYMASLWTICRSLGLASGVVALVPIMGTDYSGRFKRMSSEGSVERL